MKVLLFSDIHWCATSSIVVARGNKFSVRLHKLIDTMNWLIKVAKENGCTHVICAGDFFDKSFCTDEEITALQSVQWDNSLTYYFLVGNHESSVNSLRYSSTMLLQGQTRTVINEACTITTYEAQIHFIPYVAQTDRLPIKNYLHDVDPAKKQVIISHNDLAGINYAGFVSTTGFKLDDIEANCDAFLNGHLHNTQAISNKILNLGSVSAHNFTNDSNKYSYGVWILDTSTCKLEFIENPYAFNFYKLEINSKSDFSRLLNLKQNAVLSIKCKESLLQDIKKQINLLPNVLETRFTTSKDYEVGQGNQGQAVDLTVNHFARFQQACIERFGASDTMLYELSQICK